MKKLLFISLVIFASCKKSSPPPPASTTPTTVTAGINQITYLNGACSYNNNTFSLNPTSAHYLVNSHYTAIQQFTANRGLIVLSFPSSTTGNYFLHNNSSMGSFMTIFPADSISTCTYGDTFLPDSIVVNVTRCDNVGGLIEGTWAGRIKNQSDSTQRINANGKFSLIRGADQ